MGVVLVLAHVAFLAWALFNSWFYLDDYKLLAQARTSGLSMEYLLAPYNSHLMPGGRFIAWLVSQAGQTNWTLAAGLVLLCHALAGCAALWCLVTLFGSRWASLSLLLLYLSSAITLPATMWWTAALNQVPLQAAFFLAIGAWVEYLRHLRIRWLAITVSAVVIGLIFYVKALLILPVLGFIAVAYFADGSVVRRFRMTLRRLWLATVVGLLVVAGYVPYYTTHVSGPLGETSVDLMADISVRMLGTAFTTAAVGGPWEWAALAPPNSFASPPETLVHVAWVVIAFTIAIGALTRERSLRAWLLLVGYLLACAGLLVTSRGREFGSILALEYRYLTDAACVLMVCTGLALLGLRGAVETSRRREPSLLRVDVPVTAVISLVMVISLGGGLSSVRYAHNWHTLNPSADYAQTLRDQLNRLGHVDLVDQTVPPFVVPSIFAPDNRISLITTAMGSDVSYPEASPRLGVVAQDGTVRTALIGSGVVSEDGPVEDCGWRVTGRGRAIPLTGRAFDWIWWLRIGYLYSSESDVVVSAGGDRVEAKLQPGANSLYVRIDGTFDEVRIDGIDPGTVLCVDTIEVGPVEPGGPLE